MLSINALCKILGEYKDSHVWNESCEAFFLEGAYQESHSFLNELANVLKGADSLIAEHITFCIDDEKVATSDLQDYLLNNPFAAQFQLTLDTKDLIQEAYSGSGDVDEFLFTSYESFLSNHESLGLLSPLREGLINKATNTRIHIYGLESAFGGPKLAVVSTETDSYGDNIWLQGSSLPSSEVLLKQVHLVTSESVILEPRNFELQWGAIGDDCARVFRNAFAQQLLVALSSNYYSIDKVQFKGVKHIDASLEAPNKPVSIDCLSVLSESVKWVYSVEDPSVPLQLFVDRLSLDYETGSLLAVSSEVLKSCLEQAKSNYKFVIAKRSDDYRKELKDIYSDIKTVTDKFMEKSASLSSELLKSLLTIGFVFTVGTISKAIVNEQLLHSREGLLLFKIMGIYLIASFFIRWFNASAELKIAEGALASWSKKLHSHIPTEEVSSLIAQQTKWSRRFYLSSLALVTYIQCALGLAAYWSEGIFWYLGL
ncbi:hypothetical protein NTE10_002915 [Vibrio harveyi]|nr:hypothetical protein [Vibrio harveyi]